jgi:peptide-methionine (R)-S-oxide reductase
MTSEDKKEIRRRLSPEQYHVTQEKGTEPPFTGEYYLTKEIGIYHCVVCGQELFYSKTKFDSGSGWPSFYQPISSGAVAIVPDSSLGMIRQAVECKKCGSHLGHVFDDKSNPSGKLYCINSASLILKQNGRTID